MKKSKRFRSGVNLVEEYEKKDEKCDYILNIQINSKNLQKSAPLAIDYGQPKIPEKALELLRENGIEPFNLEDQFGNKFKAYIKDDKGYYYGHKP